MLCVLPGGGDVMRVWMSLLRRRWLDGLSIDSLKKTPSLPEVSLLFVVVVVVRDDSYEW